MSFWQNIAFDLVWLVFGAWAAIKLLRNDHYTTKYGQIIRKDQSPAWYWSVTGFFCLCAVAGAVLLVADLLRA
jgi:hypothetical protein